MHEKDDLPGQNHPDTMVLLSAVMNGIGFGEELHRLCDADVDDICEVDPKNMRCS